MTDSVVGSSGEKRDYITLEAYITMLMNSSLQKNLTPAPSLFHSCRSRTKKAQLHVSAALCTRQPLMLAVETPTSK